MRITVIILFVALFQAVAVESYSQMTKVSVKAEQIKLVELFALIEKQSEFLFFYVDADVENVKVNVSARNKQIKDILSQALAGTELTYTINDRNVSIVRKALAVAQQIRTISGVITDENGEPIIGVNVIVKGTTTGTVTDIDGRYSIEAAPGSTLQISYIGYYGKEVAVGESTKIDVILVENTQALEEVVVVGYGTQKKTNLTGAVSTVSLPEMEKRTVAQTSLALQGLVPGVVVTQRSGKPGGDGGTISVRGKTTLGNNDVLVLVDGVESSINGIDSKTIESISVLKDAASAAIYGSRAANGVILITTKRATEGRTVSYNGYVAQGKPTNVPKYVGAVDFMKYISIAKRAVGMTPEYSEDYIAEYEAGVLRGDPNYPDVDWFDATATNNGVINSHFLTISVGEKNLRSMAQAGYLSQNGITENTGFKRYTFRANTDYDVTEQLEFRGDVALIYTEEQEPAKLGTGYNWVGRIPANQAAYLADGRYGPGWQGVNPVAYYKDGGVITKNAPSGIINLTAKYNPFTFLEIKGQYAINYWESHTSNWDKRVQIYLNDGTPDPQTQSKSTLNEATDRSLRTMFNGSATFNKSFHEKHNFKLMLGYQQESFWNKWHNGYREVFPFPDYPVLNAGGQENQKASGSASDYALQSVFGRLNYNFMERYLLEFTLRHDGSSRFADGHKWGTFPSVSAGWRISEEAFWENLKETVNNLKLRASWGQLGNQNTLNGYYPAQSVVNLGTNYIFDKNITSGAAITAMANTLISWETTTSTNIGLDFSLFNKVSASFDYYHRVTDDILLNLNIPLIIGLSAPAQNAGKLENRGWEAGFEYNDKFGDFNFSAAFNLSDVKNKVLDLKGINETGITVNREGYPMYSLYGYEADGYILPEDYNSEGEYLGATQIGNFGPGDIKYKDQPTVDTDGDGIPDAGDGVLNTSDYVIMGSTIPRYTFGLNLYGEYKGLDLNLLFQGVGEANGYVWGHSIGSFYEGGSMPEIGKDYWTPENRDAQFPRLAFNNSNNQQNSSFWVKDAAYLRLKNVQLGYTLPKALISKIGVANLRFYVSTDNLFTVSKFWKYFDVEAPVLTGYSNFYPIMRTTTVGIDLKF
ncbi:MAG: TonB-dependent receptor [Tannerellaceae bacterium]|nr:TonB-dependent receptor [Tannerellaceae bacterium]